MESVLSSRTERLEIEASFREEKLVPTLSRFFGITIRMYLREHPPAHFHAIYRDLEASISIETLEPLAGALPRRAFALVLEWAMIHRPELRENWRRAERQQPLLPIAPLDEEV